MCELNKNEYKENRKNVISTKFTEKKNYVG